MSDNIQPTPSTGHTKRGLSKKAKRKIEDIIETDSDASTTAADKKRASSRSSVGGNGVQKGSMLLPQQMSTANSLSKLPAESNNPLYHHGDNYSLHGGTGLMPLIGGALNGFSNLQPPNMDAMMPIGSMGIPNHLPSMLGYTAAPNLPSHQTASQCSMCRGKDELLDIQQNMIHHLQHIVAVARNSVPLVQSMEFNYMRIAVRQGRIPRHIAQRNSMFEIPIEVASQSGVFLTPSFKYDLELNYSERGTLIAKKLLHAFFTEYDLAYAGGVFALNGKPGIDCTILAAIECFASSSAKSYADRPSIRSTLLAEISAACAGREAKGLKVFQRDRLLENPNNVPPTIFMPFVVSDIREVMYPRGSC